MIAGSYGLFAEDGRHVAVRLNMNAPSLGTFEQALGGRKGSESVAFTLLSLPLYLTDQINRFLRDLP